MNNDRVAALAKALRLGNVVTNMFLIDNGSCDLTPLLHAMKNNMMFTDLRIDHLTLDHAGGVFNALAGLRFIQHLYIHTDTTSDSMGDLKSLHMPFLETLRLVRLSSTNTLFLLDQLAGPSVKMLAVSIPTENTAEVVNGVVRFMQRSPNMLSLECWGTLGVDMSDVMSAAASHPTLQKFFLEVITRESAWRYLDTVLLNKRIVDIWLKIYPDIEEEWLKVFLARITGSNMRHLTLGSGRHALHGESPDEIRCLSEVTDFMIKTPSLSKVQFYRRLWDRHEDDDFDISKIWNLRVCYTPDNYNHRFFTSRNRLAQDINYNKKIMAKVVSVNVMGSNDVLCDTVLGWMHNMQIISAAYFSIQDNNNMTSSDDKVIQLLTDLIRGGCEVDVRDRDMSPPKQKSVDRTGVTPETKPVPVVVRDLVISDGAHHPTFCSTNSYGSGLLVNVQRKHDFQTCDLSALRKLIVHVFDVDRVGDITDLQKALHQTYYDHFVVIFDNDNESKRDLLTITSQLSCGYIIIPRKKEDRCKKGYIYPPMACIANMVEGVATDIEMSVADALILRYFLQHERWQHALFSEKEFAEMLRKLNIPTTTSLSDLADNFFQTLCLLGVYSGTSRCCMLRTDMYADMIKAFVFPDRMFLRLLHRYGSGMVRDAVSNFNNGLVHKDHLEKAWRAHVENYLRKHYDSWNCTVDEIMMFYGDTWYTICPWNGDYNKDGMFTIPSHVNMDVE